MFTEDQKRTLRALADRNGIKPINCPNCAYDRKFPETAGGGWMYPGNNGPIGPCPVCNADERYARR